MTDETTTAPNPWAALQASLPMDPADEVGDRIDRTISGELRTVGSPWAALSNMTQCLQPKTITIVCGDPGSGKSLLVLQWMAWIRANGEKMALLELECDRQYHLFRRLVQLTGEINLLDHAWIKSNGDKATHHRISHEEELNAFGACVYEAPKMNVTHKAALKWIEKAAKTCRVIAIDPVTAMTPTDKPWIEDQNFVVEASNIVKEHCASLICVTHPGKKREAVPSMKDLAGGAAWERFVDSILWVRNDGVEDVSVSGPFGNRTLVTCNRRVRMAKTRNGRGVGLDVAMHFDSKHLSFRELGVVIEDE